MKRLIITFILCTSLMCYGEEIKLDSSDVLRVEAVTPSILHITLGYNGEFQESLLKRYGIVNDDFGKIETSIDTKGDTTIISTSQVQLQVNKSGDMRLERNGTVIVTSIRPILSKQSSREKREYKKKLKSLGEYFRASEKETAEQALIGGACVGNDVILGQPGAVQKAVQKDKAVRQSPFGITFSLNDNERFYGLGASSKNKLQLRGHGYRNITEYKGHGGYDQNFAKYEQTEQPVPYIMSTDGWAVFLSTTCFNFFDVGRYKSDEMTIWGPSGQLDMYLIVGDSMADMVDQYTNITGKPRLLPLWGYGMTYVTNVVQNQHEILHDAKDFHKEGYGCDVISIEPQWMKKYYDYSHEKKWDSIDHETRGRFYMADWLPKRWSMIGALERMGYQTGLWLCTEDDFLIEEERQIAIRDGKSLKPFEKEQEAWFDHLRKFVNQGVNFFKMDPAATVNRHPWRTYYGGVGEWQAHNLQQVLLAKQMYLGMRKATGRRSMVHYCGAYAGSQHWIANTMGDVGGTEESLAWMLNLGFAGHVNLSAIMDVTYDAYHAGSGMHYGFLSTWTDMINWAMVNQPWFMTEKQQEMFRYYNNLHYRLLPYIYTMVYKGTQTGMPVVRPMPLVHEDDIECSDLTRQYMFGDWLLSGVFANSIYLPEGKWIDYWTGKIYDGGQTIKPEIPDNRGGMLFVKGGAIIPYWPLMMHVGQKPIDNLTLEIYPYGHSSFTLYEDDGNSFDHEKGMFALTEITSNEKDGKVSINISPRKGVYEGMPKARSFGMKIYTKKPRKITVNGKTFSASRWTYNVDKKFVSINVSEDINKEKDISICLK